LLQFKPISKDEANAVDNHKTSASPSVEQQAAMTEHQDTSPIADEHCIVVPSAEEQQPDPSPVSANLQIISSNSIKCEPETNDIKIPPSTSNSKNPSIDDRPRHAHIMLSKDEYQEHHSAIIQAR